MNPSLQPLPIAEVNTDTEWPSIAAAIAETPYRVPLQFDNERVRILVNAKRLEYEDHIFIARRSRLFSTLYKRVERTSAREIPECGWETSSQSSKAVVLGTSINYCGDRRMWGSLDMEID